MKQRDQDQKQRERRVYVKEDHEQETQHLFERHIHSSHYAVYPPYPTPSFHLIVPFLFYHMSLSELFAYNKVNYRVKTQKLFLSSIDTCILGFLKCDFGHWIHYIIGYNHST